MPALCQSAAAAEPVNPNLPPGTPNATGTAALAAYGCYMMGNSVIVPPAQGTYGTMTYNQLRGPGFTQLNASATKDWKLKERLTVQFRFEAFNILNRTRLGNAVTNPTLPDFGLITSRVGNRTMQIGVQYVF